VPKVIPGTIIILALLVAPLARADKAAAREAYQEGSRYYDLAEYQAALESFKKAYLQYEEPSFLFNIAQCYRQLGDRNQAIVFYRSYLRKDPNSPRRKEVRDLIASLEAAPDRNPAPVAPPASGQHDTQVLVGTPTSPPTSAPSAAEPAAEKSNATPASPREEVAVTTTATRPHKPSAAKKWWIWTTVGVVVVGAGLGIGLGLGLHGSSEGTFNTVHVGP
jgi:tetratricopeptide (TPR) repeat protein